MISPAFWISTPVALAEAEPRDLVPVVDGRAGHGRAGDVDRLEDRDRRGGPRPADVDLEVAQHRRHLAGGELERDRPPRKFRRGPSAPRCAKSSTLITRPSSS